MVRMHAGTAPQPRHSHAAAVIQQCMYMCGGTQDYQHTFSDMHALDLKTGEWGLLHAASTVSSPSCFSHSLTAVGGLLVLAGGCHTLGAGQSLTLLYLPVYTLPTNGH